MNNSDAVLQELETHVQRILANYDPKQPHMNVLNVTAHRGNLAAALTRLIDQRIQEALRKYDEQLTQKMDARRRP